VVTGSPLLRAHAHPQQARVRVPPTTTYCCPCAALCRREMLDLDWGCPFLFLYSADDPLCDVRKLEELINDKRQRCAREARALGCAAVSLT